MCGYLWLQYLKSTVKFKTDAQVLSDDQSRWVDKSKRYVYDLLGETPPDGKAFAASVRHILDREQQWNEWKNEGCKSLKDPKAAEASSPLKKKLSVTRGSTRKRSKPVGEQIREASANKRFLMGNANLTKLWNLCPDNMEV